MLFSRKRTKKKKSSDEFIPVVLRLHGQHLKTLNHLDAQILPQHSSLFLVCLLPGLAGKKRKLNSVPLADCKGSEHKSPGVNLGHAHCSLSKFKSRAKSQGKCEGVLWRGCESE